MPTIEAELVDEATGSRRPGLKLVASYRLSGHQELLRGEATSGPDGVATLEFPMTIFANRAPSDRLDVGFEVYRGVERLKSSGGITGLKPTDHKVTLTVALANEGRAFRVQGRIADEAGRPLPGLTVRALDRDMREEWSQALGESPSDGHGRYEIIYNETQVRRAEKERADLVVRASDAQGVVLAESDIVFNARPDQTIDLTVAAARARTIAGTSEFERNVRELTPLIKDVPLSELTDDDLLFLGRETGLSAEHLRYVRLDASWGSTHGVSPAVFYGLLRQGLPSTYRRLLSQKPRPIRAALEASIGANIVPTALGADLDRILERLAELAVQSAFEADDTVAAAPLGVLLRTAPDVTAEQQEQVVQFALRDEDNGDFWRRLRQATSLDEGAIGAVRFTVGLGTISHHLPLIGLLQAERQEGAIGTLRDLARLTKDDWRALVDQTGPPAETPGETEEARAATYALQMAHQVEDAFPTASVADKLARDERLEMPLKQDIARFLLEAPGFDLERSNVHAYIAAHSAPDGIDGARFEDDVKRLQRVFKLAPATDRFEAMQVLLEAGLDSAQRINRMTETTFLSEYSEALGGAERARLIRRRAGRIAAESQSLLAEYGATYNSVSLAVTSDTAAEISRIPELRALFGSLSFCECEHCRSVYSPAAYLVDLLEFLDSVVMTPDDGTASYTARDVLFERRAEIGEILLSCRNTNTVVPYVDLVNEVLENAIAPTGTVPQTEGAPEDIRVVPEHLNADAYDELAEAVYPWSLPFALPAEEARVWLNHLGVPRHELMQVFRRDGADPQPFHVAGESLRLTTLDRQLITGTAPHQPYEVWGLQEVGNVLPDTEHPGGTVSLSWIDVLRRVPAFLDQSGLSFEELTGLLDAQYINDGSLVIEFPEPTSAEAPLDGGNCDPDRARLALPAADFEAAVVLDRIQRFARLQRKLEWSVADVDVALRALSAAPHNPTDDVLIQLAHTTELRAKLQVPVVEMMSWWAPIDTARYAAAPSLYERVFLSKAVANPVDDAFELDSSRTELASTSDMLARHATSLTAALGITEDELSLLVEEALSDDALSLANLSALFRCVSLARACRLPLRDFLRLRAMSGENPFASPGRARAFVALADGIDDSGLAIDRLDYALNHRAHPSAASVPGPARVSQFLAELRRGLKDIVEANRVPPDPVGERVSKALGGLFREDVADRAFALVSGDAVEGEAAQRAFIATHFAPALDLSGVPVLAAQDALVGEAALTTRADRCAYVLPIVLAYLTQLQQTNLVKHRFAEELGLEVAASDLLLNALVPSRVDPSRPAIDEFLAEAFVTSNAERITRELFAPQVDGFLLLHKIASLVEALVVPADKLGWVFSKAAELGWLDLTDLPLTEVAPDHARLQAWLAMAKAARLERTLPRGEPHVFSLLDMVIGIDAAASADDKNEAKSTWLEGLRTRTHWRLEDLVALLGQRDDHAEGGLLAVRFPEDLAGEEALERLVHLERAFDQLRILGVSAQQSWHWATPSITSDMAADMRKAAKARYDDQRWGSIATPLRDELREHQRFALAAYLLGHGPASSAPAGFAGSEDLFSHYLIDVEMSACMMTSRIKQAISSVQLFIQRCLMNLERRVALPTEHARRWDTWMRSYRVWEANRKIFLYPENWIEPELRDDKSPFFKDLENALLQDEVRADSAERSLLDYLEKLDGVARLEMTGMCRQEEEDREIFHILGRTRNAPHIYYHRRWVNRSYWTPWERVDVDIQGDHLIPIVWNRRLYLFWLTFTEKAEQPETISETHPALAPMKYWEIQLAWSKSENGRWSAKSVGEEVIDLRRHLGRPERFAPQSTFFLRGEVGSRGLVISCLRADPGSSGYTPLADFSFRGRDESYVILARASWREGGAWGDAGGGSAFVPLRLPRGSSVDKMRFLESSGDTLELPETPGHVLGSTPGRYRIIYEHERTPRWFQGEFFYEDDTRTFFVSPESVAIDLGVYGPLGGSRGLISAGYRFRAFVHPYVRTFTEQVNRHGVDGLLGPASDGERGRLSRQLLEEHYFGPEPPESENLYEPSPAVWDPYPHDEIDFSHGGAYSIYNWELFLHAPMLIADRLSKNLRFAEAQRWFHFIFDPTAGDDPSLDAADRRSAARFWKIRPFFETERIGGDRRPHSISFLLRLLSYDGSDAALRELKTDFEGQIDEWRSDPFKPHLIARSRTSAYQWAVVMKYLDNLIAWGDQLFRRDTIESINEATQLYVLVAQILGDRPPRLSTEAPRARTYNELLAEGIDAFDNALVEIENAIAPSVDGLDELASGSDGLPALRTLYFCIPPNEKLLGYWDTVADRLFKIRHCMTLEGVVRQLPLFEPPIEPGLLVRAAEAGVDLSSAISGLHVPPPRYRFRATLQKAMEFCNDVQALGASLLSALEKKDAEELALLRSEHELALLGAVRQIKEHQVREAEETIAGLEKSKSAAAMRRDHYLQLLDGQIVDPEGAEVEAGPEGRLLPTEIQEQEKLADSHDWELVGQRLEVLAAGLPLIGEFDVGSSGWAGTPVVKWRWGGLNLAAMAQATGRQLALMSTLARNESTRAAVKSRNIRRAEDWRLQAQSAAKDVTQIESQIAAAEIRRAIAAKDLTNHDLQAENASEVDAYMRGKFTSAELYGWMQSQLSALYFQSYQMAYDLARRAERAFGRELGISDTTFIEPGYWDSLRKGLLAGDKLHHDLRRMELAYLEQNTREYELTKYISLAGLSPEALIRLRETGECIFQVPEVIYDLDHPGHYLRRIKSVSLTIPAVTGPYTNVSCTLTLHRSRVRTITDTARGYAWRHDSTEDRFLDDLTGIQSIATSSAREDSGLFELTFHDERYLPFEGAGVISTWHLALPKEFRQFDYDTIADVVMRMQYNARDGGEAFRAEAEAETGALLNRWLDDLAEARTPLSRLLSLREEFSTEFHAFLHPREGDAAHEARLDIDETRFPQVVQGMALPLVEGAVAQFAVFLRPKSVTRYPEFSGVPISIAKDGAVRGSTLMPDASLRELPVAVFPDPSDSSAGRLAGPVTGEWTLGIRREDMPDASAIEDILLLVRYEVRRPS